ncbi:hypothetical protein [Nocardioides sp. SYSU DS0651]|uniref:hypothetical protein n=1 Tax=Nocardioides sp. SYSU DS0651 TaxID=3415955 RepID=UPI003F4BCC00
MRSTPHRTRPAPPGEAPGRPRLLAVAAVLLLALTGCTGDGEGSGGGGGGPAAGADTSVRTNAKLGEVRGPLTKGRARKVTAEVTAVVERWSDAAYGGDYPRDDFGAAYEEFTKEARALARKQPGIMSNARIGSDVESVEMVQRVVRVDLVAPRGRPAGATARFRLELATSGGAERTDVVSGRLLLTPARGGWRVFGFDVQREEGAK